MPISGKEIQVLVVLIVIVVGIMYLTIKFAAGRGKK
jgi:hypothetical protein